MNSKLIGLGLLVFIAVLMDNKFCYETIFLFDLVRKDIATRCF